MLTTATPEVRRERHSAQKPRVAVSACLVGDRVRWDGGDKRDPRVEALAETFELLPFCPEVALGLGVPREPIDLIDRGGEVRLEGRGGADHTRAMRALAARRIDELVDAGVCGHVLKARSPSCGPGDAAVIRDGVRVERAASGLFAAAILSDERLAGLPAIAEDELAEPPRRASFCRRVRAWSRVSNALGPDLDAWRRADLVALHSREKLLVMAYSPAIYRELGTLVAGAANGEPRAIALRYRALLLEALDAETTTGRHVNALQHIAGYLEGGDRAAANTAIERFATGASDLAAVKARLRAAARSSGHDYLVAQTYLDPEAD